MKSKANNARTNYHRSLCVSWLRLNHPDVYLGLHRIAAKKFPLVRVTGPKVGTQKVRLEDVVEGM